MIPTTIRARIKDADLVLSFRSTCAAPGRLIATRETSRVAVQAAAVPVSRMARMAFVAGVLPVILRVLVACCACDSRVAPRLDIEPIGAVGVNPRILEVTLLAIPTRAVCGVREPGAPVIGLVTARAFRRPRHDLEGLQVAVAIAAFESAVRPHQRETRLVVVEPSDVPGR